MYICLHICREALEHLYPVCYDSANTAGGRVVVKGDEAANFRHRLSCIGKNGFVIVLREKARLEKRNLKME